MKLFNKSKRSKNENTTISKSVDKILKENNNTIDIDKFVEFIINAKVIHEKYIPQTVHEYHSEVFTMLFVNYIEEYYEYEEELEKACELFSSGKNDNIEDLKYELIDMINYLGSIFTMYDFKYEQLENMETKDLQFYYKTFYEHLFKSSLEKSFKELLRKRNEDELEKMCWIINKNDLSNKQGVENFLMLLSTVDFISNDCILELSRIRRLYPERKWHKPQKPLPFKEEKDLVLHDIRTITLKYMTNYISILMCIELYEYFMSKDKTPISVEKLYNMALDDMIKKQSVTLNLDKKEEN